MSNDKIVFIGKTTVQVFDLNENEWVFGENSGVDANNCNKFVF